MTVEEVSASDLLDRIKTLCGPMAINEQEDASTCFVGDDRRGNAFLHLVETDASVMIYVDRHSISEPKILIDRGEEHRTADCEENLVPPTVEDHVQDYWVWLNEAYDDHYSQLGWLSGGPTLTKTLLDESEPPTSEHFESKLYDDLRRRNSAVLPDKQDLPQRFQGWFDCRFPVIPFQWPDVSFEVLVRRAYAQVDSS